MVVATFSVKIVGGAKVEWSERIIKGRNRSEESRLETVHYSGNQEYFSNKYYLLGGKTGEVELRPGINLYPFSAFLPPGLPSSFTGKYGYVRYSVIATLHRPWRFDEHVTADFEVVTPINLNSFNKAKEPVIQEIEKHFCCLWCSSGPLQLVVSMPYSGFVPGEYIPITIEVDNLSNVQVDNIIITLNKNLTWMASSPETMKKYNKELLRELILEGVGPHGLKSWNTSIEVPSITPINLDLCSTINCSFSIEVKATVGGCHKSLTSDIPIIIGDIPFHHNVMDQTNRSSLAFLPSAPKIPPTDTTPLL